MNISIKKIDSLSTIEINGMLIENVVNYQMSTTAHGETELVIKIKFYDSISVFEASTNSK